MDLLKNSIKECFDFCFNENSSLDQRKTLFSVFKNSQPKGYEYYYPIQISWKLTSECNLRCKHCFYYENRDKNFDSSEDLTKDEALKIAKSFVEDLNIMSVSFTGGEALLAPYFKELAEYFKSKNVCIAILTNGTLLTEPTVSMLSKILNPKYDYIQVSLDGACAETHDKIRGEGSFQKTIHGLKNLAKYKIPTGISTTVTSYNVQKLENFAEICDKYSIKELNLNRYKVFSKEQEYLRPDLELLFINFAKLAKKIKNTKLKQNFFQAYDFLKYDYGKELFDKYNPPAKYSNNKRCHNHSRFHMTASGKIYLCPSAECSSLCLGDLRKNSFDEIWEKRFSNPLFQKRQIEDMICSKCTYNKWCNTGCAVTVLNNYGNVLSPAVECNYRKVLEEK